MEGKASITFTGNDMQLDECVSITSPYANNITTNIQERDYQISVRGNWLNKEETMIESLEIVRLYKSNRMDSINKKFEESKEELIDKDVNIKAMNDLKSSFKKDLTELYKSQLPKKEVDDLDITVDDEKALLTINELEWFIGAINNNLHPNSGYVTEGIQELEVEKEKLIKELDVLVSSVSAALKICKSKEEVEDELIKYEIYDKKTKKINLI